jgi:hypothetical protein
MKGTEVRVRSCRRESVRKALARLQYRRFLELIARAHDRVRHLVVVGPGHRRAGRHRECLGRETEVIDHNLSLVRVDGN